MDDIQLSYLKEINKQLEQLEQNKIDNCQKYELKLENLKMELFPGKLTGIKNYYRYFFCTRLNLLNTTLNDFDKYEKVKDQLFLYYKNIGIEIEKLHGRYFRIDNKYSFETDTANSFRTLFHDYLRNYFNEDFMKYQEEFNINSKTQNAEIYQASYILRNIDDIYDRASDKKILDLFNTFAFVYHSVDNVILVPCFYNVLRKHKEIYPLDMEDLYEKYGFNESFINKITRFNIAEWDMERCKKIEYNIIKTNDKNIKNSLDDYEYYINKVLEIINKKIVTNYLKIN